MTSRLGSLRTWRLAQITYQTLVTSLYQTVLGMLATPERYATARNTAVLAIKTLPAMAASDLSSTQTALAMSNGRRRLLQEASAAAGCGPLARAALAPAARHRGGSWLLSIVAGCAQLC